MSSFLNSLFILEINPLSNVGLVKIFSQSVGCHFVLMTMSFALQKLLSFRRSHLLIFSPSVCATEVIIFRMYFLCQCTQVYFPLCLLRFSVVCFMLRSLIHLDLNFVHGNRYGSIFIPLLLISSYTGTMC